jgi:uncharacterized protein (UPF0332 family)
MPLNLKSDQNILLIDYFENKDKDFWGALGGRPYYSVFQKIKKLLVDNKFDYRAFLKKINREETAHNYDHGTIGAAFTDFVLNVKRKKINLAEMRCINGIDNLYRLRLKSDYKDVNITKPEVIQTARKAKEVINFIKALGVENE